MSSEANKALTRRFYEVVWNEGDLAAIDATLAPEFVDHDPMEAATGRRGPDPGTLIAIWRATGTNLGPFLGRPPTGKPVTITGMWLDRVEDGHIVESWTNWDTLGLLQQLGWVPRLG